IECYRRVLIADPRSERARANLELALRRKGEGSPPARDGQKTSPAIRGQETGPIAPAAAKLEALERLSRDKWLEAQRASWRLRRPAAGSVDR
ncbi:MAG TPA: hypothetical protein VFG83_03740, partial [Kofleriaceae bacterium]|nr:hypothetical protein [Kofleriaceae bacterium]